MAEHVANFVATLLNGAITNVATSATVDATTGFPAVNFRLVIQDSEDDDTNREVVLVTNVAGLVLTITRGQEGTTGVAHGDNSYVAHVLTYEGLRQASPAWLQDVDESGVSFANFTAGSGTWASDGTIIAQTDTAATLQEARYNTKIPSGQPIIMEAEIRFPTTGAGGGGTRIGGFLLGFDGTDGTTGYGVRLSESGDTIDLESALTTTVRSIAATIAKDIWYKLRVARGSGHCDVYLDGTLMGTVRMGSVAFDVVADFVGIYTYGTRVDFRNIKVWTLRGGLPA